MYGGRNFPLYIACQNRHYNLVYHLLNNWADINLCKKNGANPLDTGSQKRHDSTVQLLLYHSNSLNVQNKAAAK